MFYGVNVYYALAFVVLKSHLIERDDEDEDVTRLVIRCLFTRDLKTPGLLEVRKNRRRQVIPYLSGLPCQGIFLIVPEDVPTGLAAIYGFSPRIVTGRDHRVGFGFRFGNHADFQVQYELGPQLLTQPLAKIIQPRSSSFRQRIVRRPFLQILLRAGLLKDSAYDFDYDDQPR